LVEHLLVRPIDDEFLFAHALIRDAVYDTLLGARRRELHRRAAEWFATRDLVLSAEHLDRAEDPGASHAYLAAAREQAREYRYDRARALTERGLALADDPPARFALTCLHGEILHDIGAMAESRAAFERALEAAGDDRERASAWLGLAAAKRVTDDLDGAFADLDRAQARLNSRGWSSCAPASISCVLQTEHPPRLGTLENQLFTILHQMICYSKSLKYRKSR
jgi:tetratricopeptide (TPR) repeat protein